MKKILIVEDDPIIQNELKELLDTSGYEGIILRNFNKAYEDIIGINADLILLDINIPYQNGEILLKKLRSKINTPIIMLTSKNTEVDEVLSMSYGADDYITKPYNPTILILRIESIFKRMNQVSDVLSYKKLLIVPKKGIMKCDTKEVILTKNEMIIMSYLISKNGQIVSRDELMTDLWNNDEYINDNALTVNISRLRSKLKELDCEDMIETRKGQGYILL